MELKLFGFDPSFQELGVFEVSQSFFDVVINASILKDVLRWQSYKKRSGTSNTKTIAFINATKAKPYRQKGTGRARQGSLVASQFRGGAVVFGPVIRDHSIKINKKVRKLAVRMALRLKYDANSLFCFSPYKNDLANPSAKEFRNIETSFENKKILFVGNKNENIIFKKSIMNLPKVKFLDIEGLNVYDILNHDIVLFSTENNNYLKN